jgi:mono/diheme cytochrome c family protein
MIRGNLFLLVAVASASAGCLDEDLINPMAARQPRVGFYSGSEFHSDGMGMREPPKGTVPRERIVLNPGLASGKIAGPNATETYVTAFPLKVDRPLLALGRKRYDITCGTCHGPVGDGDSIVAHQMSLRPPPSLHLYAQKPPGYIYDVITHGFGMMASYAGELTVRERWAVVAYVRALQLSQATPLDKAPPEAKAKLTATGASDEPEAPAKPAHAPHQEGQ